MVCPLHIHVGICTPCGLSNIITFFVVGFCSDYHFLMGQGLHWPIISGILPDKHVLETKSAVRPPAVIFILNSSKTFFIKMQHSDS